MRVGNKLFLSSAATVLLVLASLIFGTALEQKDDSLVDKQELGAAKKASMQPETGFLNSKRPPVKDKQDKARPESPPDLPSRRNVGVFIQPWDVRQYPSIGRVNVGGYTPRVGDLSSVAPLEAPVNVGSYAPPPGHMPIASSAGEKHNSGGYVAAPGAAQTDGRGGEGKVNSGAFVAPPP